MKFDPISGLGVAPFVTPLAGVWIEISCSPQICRNDSVTPLAGVWIEMNQSKDTLDMKLVTPLAGVWIEIEKYGMQIMVGQGHSPCGSVD